jgi:hypothetical protein
VAQDARAGPFRKMKWRGPLRSGMTCTATGRVLAEAVKDVDQTALEHWARRIIQPLPLLSIVE